MSSIDPNKPGDLNTGDQFEDSAGPTTSGLQDDHAAGAPGQTTSFTSHHMGMGPGYMDPEPEMPGVGNSPFSPFSPEFDLGLREEDVVEPFSPVPGVEPRKPSILLTPEEKEAALKELLKNEMMLVSDSGHLVLEFGPLAALEKRLRNITRDFADPDVAVVVTGEMRRCTHNAVVSNTLLGEKETTEAGLIARIDAVEDLEKAFSNRMEPLLTRLAETGLDVEPLRTGLRNTLEVERKRLESMQATLVPASLGNTIIEGLRDMAKSVSENLSGKKELVGDMRRHRNEQLSTHLQQLVEVSYEIRTKTGDEEWERGEGVMATKVASELAAGIQNLTRGVEDQIDFGLLNKGLGDASNNLSAASQAAATEAHKESLKRMVAFIRTVVNAVSNALKRVFGHDTGGSSNGPSA